MIIKLFRLKAMFLCTIALYGIIPANAQYTGDKFANARSKGEAEVTYAYVNTPGFIEKTPAGDMKGLLVDIINEFHNYVMYEKSIQVKAKFIKLGDFKVFLEKVKNSQGGVFGLSNVTITENRKKSYNFSHPFISNIAVIISSKNVATLSNIQSFSEAFKGKTAYVLPKSTHEKRMLALKKEHFPAMNITYLPTEEKIMNKVISDPNAFASVDFVYFLNALQSKKPIKRHPFGDGGNEQLGIIMPKSNDWSKLLSIFLKKYVTSINYRQKVAKNLGANALKLLDGLSKNKAN